MLLKYNEIWSEIEDFIYFIYSFIYFIYLLLIKRVTYLLGNS